MPDGEARKKRNESAKTQQVNDRLIKQVASGKMTYEEARKRQDEMDAKKLAVQKVGYTTKGSSQNLGSKRTYKDAEFRRNNKGNLEAY